jgi:hypothetical protein
VQFHQFRWSRQISLFELLGVCPFLLERTVTGVSHFFFFYVFDFLVSFRMSKDNSPYSASKLMHFAFSMGIETKNLLCR